jgi:hypothetical protein
MAYRQFFLFIEGDDDERFFTRVFLPRLRLIYQHVSTVQYSTRKKAWIDAYLASVASIGADYLFVGDLDRLPCASAKKRHLVKDHPRLDPARILVVKVEIESWYCAGVGEEHSRFGALDLARCAETAVVTKERFDAAVSPRTTRLEAMIELLEAFDSATAARRNESFRYFVRKHLSLAV